MLVFLPGQEEIEECASLLQQRTQQLRLQLLLCPLFANLPPHEQARVFEPAPKDTRKVILSTNIAETSVTIAGVRFVVDCGLVKQRAYKNTTGVDSLVVTSISKNSATQRAGRAGREAPGKCFRIYT